MLELQFEWDQTKSDANLRRRGFNFEFASRVFDGRVIVAEDRRRDYGERRFIAVGSIGAVPFTVVFTDRVTVGGAILRRLISARRSSRRERTSYSKTATAAAGPRTS
jgi:uncharacterized DUF497 family protein